MGELHLEVIKERFLKNYGLKVFFGALQVEQWIFFTFVVSLKRNLNLDWISRNDFIGNISFGVGGRNFGWPDSCGNFKFINIT